MFQRSKFDNVKSKVFSDSKRQMGLNFYSNLISPGDLVFDVGANVGSKTRIFLELGANVVSIEPQEACAEILHGLKNKIKLRDDQGFAIIQTALGETECKSEMIKSNASVLSTMSNEWIDVMTKSGRFENYSWNERITVSVTTLDKLIEEYGTPSYIKIDVEGYELDVLKGLTKPIKYVSLEFAPEFLHNTYKCIEYIESLGEVVFNYSLGESMQMGLDNYVASNILIDILNRFKNNYKIFGDIYCQYL